MSHKYVDQGNIGIYLPPGNYRVDLYNDSVLAGEYHQVTLTLNLELAHNPGVKQIARSLFHIRLGVFKIEYYFQPSLSERCSSHY
jgi:hypothetical protein